MGEWVVFVGYIIGDGVCAWSTCVLTHSHMKCWYNWDRCGVVWVFNLWMNHCRYDQEMSLIGARISVFLFDYHTFVVWVYVCVCDRLESQTNFVYALCLFANISFFLVLYSEFSFKVVLTIVMSIIRLLVIIHIPHSRWTMHINSFFSGTILACSIHFFVQIMWFSPSFNSTFFFFQLPQWIWRNDPSTGHWQRPQRPLWTRIPGTLYYISLCCMFLNAHHGHHGNISAILPRVDRSLFISTWRTPRNSFPRLTQFLTPQPRPCPIPCYCSTTSCR